MVDKSPNANQQLLAAGATALLLNFSLSENCLLVHNMIVRKKNRSELKNKIYFTLLH